MRKRFGLRRYAGVTMLVAAATVVVLAFAGGASAVVTGAGYTTNDPNLDGSGTCLNGNSDPNPSVNCNHYGSKAYVWTNGGPSSGTNQLSSGTYFFAVVEPGGENSSVNDNGPKNLSDENPLGGSPTAGCATDTGCGDAYTNRQFTVDATGKATAYLGSHATDAFYNPPSGLFINLLPYDDTSNPGGVYIMAMCRLDTGLGGAIVYPVAPSACKYDAFKAPPAGTTCSENCGPDPFGTVSGAKYYDADLSGTLTPGDTPIQGWKIDWSDGLSGVFTTDASGAFSGTFTADTYTFREKAATNTTGAPFNLPSWIQTGNTSGQFLDTGGDLTALNGDKSYTVAVTDGGATSGILFGNICLGGRGGGLTLGYWSNKNGQSDMTTKGGGMAANLAFLSGLNLRNAAGANFDPANYASFRSWILGATATNMAYMLSAQLAAMELNVRLGYVSGGSSVYVGGSINALMTVNALMTAANASLLSDPVTVASGAARTYQEMLKSALDAGNNNANFPQPDSTKCPAPTFATP
jgi:hypothetical protein